VLLELETSVKVVYESQQCVTQIRNSFEYLLSLLRTRLLLASSIEFCFHLIMKRGCLLILFVKNALSV